MRHISFATLLMLPIVAVAQTAVIQDTTELAKVLNYSPIQGPQVAKEVCTPVAITQPNGNNAGAEIAGGLVGALVGSRFGGGNGKVGTTIAGAVGGTMLGEALGSGQSTRPEQACSTVYEQGPPSGYQVTYEYKGKLLSAMTRVPPGQYLTVHSRITVD